MTIGPATRRSLLAGLVGLPALLAVLWFGFKGIELSLVDPVSQRLVAANLSEAVALNDRAATFWLLKKGADPNKSYPVRADMIVGYPVYVTPLEAMVFTRQVSMFEHLSDNGALMTGQEPRFLFCLALDVVAAEVSRVILRTAGIAPSTVECQPGAAVDRIRAQRVEDRSPTNRLD